MEFKLLLDACPYGIFVIDAQGHPFYANLMALKILGKGVLESASLEHLNKIYQSYLIGTNQLYPATDHPLLRALQGETVTIQDMEIHQGGQIIPIELSAAPVFNEQGQILYAIAVFTNIQERCDQQDIWDKNQQQLIRRNQGLLQENQSLKQQIQQLQQTLNQR